MVRPDPRELVVSAIANAEHDTDGYKYVKDELAITSIDAVTTAIEALPIDPISGALIGIDISHKRIHEGSHFTYFHSDATATNIGERTLIAFKTPNTTARIHFLYQA
ncbi:hypothetical protein LCGC14_2006490, partial [marine sediment metagenome]